MNPISSYISSFAYKHGFALSLFFVIFSFCFFSGGLVVANGQTVGPTDSRVVTLYDKGQATDIPTRARTVEEFLQKAGVQLHEGDVVEPIAQTFIDGDSFRVQIFRARPVLILDGATQTRVMTPHDSPRLIAEKAGIAVYPEDNLTLAQSSNVILEPTLGEKLTIDRATPVTLSLYGAPAVPIRTHASTVGELLAERKITPEAGATIVPVAGTPLAPNLAVFISKFGKQVVSVEEAVPFATETINDPNLNFGRTEVRTAGVKGKKQVTYEIELRDGKEVGRRVLQEVVIEQPQKQVTVRGTKPIVVSGDKGQWMAAAGIAPDQMAAADFVIGHESGWRPGARNASGCLGLGQACPGSKLINACPNWESDPVCQLRFFSGYANGRYGSWQGAYNFWLVNHWW